MEARQISHLAWARERGTVTGPALVRELVVLTRQVRGRRPLRMAALTATAVLAFGLGALGAADAKLAAIGVLIATACIVIFSVRGVFVAQLLTGIVLVGALADIPRKVSIGPVTGLGAITILFLVATIPFWIAKPRAFSVVPLSFRILLIWIAFVSCVFLPSKIGFQNILVYVVFFSTIATAAFITRNTSRFTRRVDLTFWTAGWLSTGLYGASVVLFGLGTGKVIGSRSYALFAIPVLGWALSRFRFERKCGFLVVAILGATLVSLSRGAFGAECVMIGLTWFNPRRVASWVKSGLAAAVVIFVFVFAVQNFGPFHQRFEQGAITTIDGISINTTGRAPLWSLIWNDYKQSPWIGRGAGSADDLAASAFGTGAGNPHNDYLRLIHDYGPVALFLWILGYLGLLRRTHRGARERTPLARCHLGAFLAMIGVSIEMFVDNPMIELGVMAPLALLIGISIALSRDGRQDDASVEARVGFLS